MNWTVWIALGSIFAGLGVALGAFGAHALKVRLSPNDLAIFETAVRYQIYHAFALLGVGFVAMKIESTLVKVSGWLFFAGILIFSGSLYTLVATGIRGLGAITPIGGMFFLVAWSCLALAALKA